MIKEVEQVLNDEISSLNDENTPESTELAEILKGYKENLPFMEDEGEEYVEAFYNYIKQGKYKEDNNLTEELPMFDFEDIEDYDTYFFSKDSAQGYYDSGYLLIFNIKEDYCFVAYGGEDIVEAVRCDIINGDYIDYQGDEISLAEVFSTESY